MKNGATVQGMTSLLKEFREFASRGNVLDMAVGVILGTAFGKIVTSFVEDVFMPPLSLLTGKVDFANRFISLSGEYDSLAAAKAAGAVTINYGMFMNNVLSFLIIAFSIFLMVRQINALKRLGAKEAKQEEPVTKECPFCFSSISRKATRCPSCTSELQKN
jgi:large conductance mechanosensitive channel